VLICVLTKHALNFGGSFILSECTSVIGYLDLFLIAYFLVRDVFQLGEYCIKGGPKILQSNLCRLFSSS